jgi:hypothetical protein
MAHRPVSQAGAVDRQSPNERNQTAQKSHSRFGGTEMYRSFTAVTVACWCALVAAGHAQNLCRYDAPCFRAAYQDCHKVIFDFGGVSGFDFYNVRYATEGGGTAQVENDSGIFVIDDAHANSTYTITVQGCNSSFLSSSDCSVWQSQSFTTQMDWGRCAPRDTSVEITCGQSPRALDLDLAQVRDGGRIQLWDFWNGDNQRWYLDEYGNIRSDHARGYCLDADLNTIGRNGTVVQLWHCNNWQNQKWHRNYDGTITNATSGQCLDADLNTIGHNGTVVQLWQCNTGRNQQWWF